MAPLHRGSAGPPGPALGGGDARRERPARGSLQGCGVESVPVVLVRSKHPMPSVPEPRGRPRPSGNPAPSPSSSFALSGNPSPGRACQLIHGHQLIPNPAPSR
ncbi:hypothetical protein EYF80_047577 [Liparis tanakae]|uniref:Uncharacterized protein n=1 Tax=Liparis tanakae TaxID=230148 RepID=A0A4Z2FLX5_9TELE|nr:hypothetical protein EYF80_047577 [Liparis tanakae]